MEKFDKKKIIHEALESYDKENQKIINELIYGYRCISNEVSSNGSSEYLENTFAEEQHKDLLNGVKQLIEIGLRISGDDVGDFNEDLINLQWEFITRDEVDNYINNYAKNNYPKEYTELDLKLEEEYEKKEKEWKEELEEKRRNGTYKEFDSLGEIIRYSPFSLGDLIENDYQEISNKFCRYYFIREFLETTIEYYNILQRMTQINIDEDKNIKITKKTYYSGLSVLPYLYEYKDNPEITEFYKKLLKLPLNIENILKNKYDYSQKAIKKIIKKGENEILEFKSTLRTNLKTEEIDEKIENATLKTIVAFLNTEGGTLLIGVKDDKIILGIDNWEGLENEDKFDRHLRQSIKDRIKKEIYSRLIRTQYMDIDKKKVLIITCRSRRTCFPKSSPATLNGIIYVRRGSRSDPIDPSEYSEDYIN